MGCEERRNQLHVLKIMKRDKEAGRERESKAGKIKRIQAVLWNPRNLRSNDKCYGRW